MDEVEDMKEGVMIETEVVVDLIETEVVAMIETTGAAALIEIGDMVVEVEATGLTRGMEADLEIEMRVSVRVNLLVAGAEDHPGKLQIETDYEAPRFYDQLEGSMLIQIIWYICVKLHCFINFRCEAGMMS